MSTKKTTFRTVDAIFLITIMGLVITVSGLIVREAMANRGMNLAQSGAEALALQLASGGFMAMEEADPATTERGSGRFPASIPAASESSFPPEGQIGEDPWGQAYRYKKLNLSGQELKILVWSKGPNNVQDTPETQFSETNLSTDSVSFWGDDTGYFYTQRLQR